MKRVIAFLLAAVLLPACSNMISSNNGPNVSQLSSLETTTIAAIVKPYRENLLRANNQNGGEWVKVSGYAQTTRKNDFPNIYPYSLDITENSIKAKDRGSRIICNFASKNENILMQLKDGDSVVITGKFIKDVKSPDTITLDDCSIQSYKASRAK